MSRRGVENNRGISGHLFTLHQRLYHALNFGFSCYNGKGRKWHCPDIEMQKHVVRSMSAFLDCISIETAQHPFIKDSVADMIVALEGILRCNSEAVLTMTAKAVIKLVCNFPASILQSHIIDLIQPLSSLLSFHQSKVARRCANALNFILSNLNIIGYGVVWETLEETNAVIHIVKNIQVFSSEVESIEYFQEMASLLSRILWRWPRSRCRVWSAAGLLGVLEVIRAKPDSSVRVAVLQLYSALALCGNGAGKLLENGEDLLQMLVQCMGSKYPHFVRIEGFKLAQLLAINEQGCSKMMRLCCGPIVQAIIGGLSGCSLHAGKVANDQMSLSMEAGRLALITRWAGEHHGYFWKLGIDKVLLDLLVSKFHKAQSPQQGMSLEEQIATAEEGLNTNFLIVMRPFVWDILGGLASHCGEHFNPKMNGSELHINLLITCTCLAFLDAIRKGCQICQNDADVSSGCAASRAVLMMIYSPCKYISSQSRSILSEILKPEGKQYLKYLLDYLYYVPSRVEFARADDRTVIGLLSLTCYAGLPQYRRRMINSDGVKRLLVFVEWCLKNDDRLGRQHIAPHLQNMFSSRTCCQTCTEDWDSGNILLLFGLWCLAELLHHSGPIRNRPDLFSGDMGYNEAQLISKLQEICSDTSAPGPRWYAAYLLSYFGLYGFPSKLGKRIGNILGEKEYADMQLLLKSGESLSVHSVILMARCPLMLQTAELPLDEKRSDGPSVGQYTELTKKFKKEVHLSAHVDQLALLKLLVFVYSGYLQAGEDFVKMLKHFAKNCELQPLLQMLRRNRPKWGTPFPRLDLAPALGSDGHAFSDVILEAEATELTHWTCAFCSLSMPHLHVHKVLLWSSCGYLRAMFRSGMQESHSHIIKVPVSWDAVVKLVDWLYSDKLPTLSAGCLWHSMDTGEKIQKLQPYLELCWLADYWFLEDIQEHCSRVIISCLDSARHLSLEVLQIAAKFSLLKLAEIAANYLAPSYGHLRRSGEIEKLDVKLIEMVRAASVQLSQADSRGLS